MVKRSRKISSSEDINWEFFKVFLPSFSSKHLAIPPAFVRHLEGTMSKCVILRDYTGKQWHGKMEKVEGGLVIKDCWERFSHQHSLEHGDFLIFKYNGSALFDVKIFGKNGCRKEEIANMNTTHVKREMETEAEQTSNREGHAYKQEYSETLLKTSEKLTGSSGANQAKTIKEVTNLPECKAFKAVRYVVPKNPYFVSAISRHSRYVVGISLTKLKSHGIKLKSDVTLLDQNGGEWPVKLTFRKDGRAAITSGWSEFRSKNNLEIGDKCLFEFVLGRGNISKAMKVQVIHKAAANAKDSRGCLKQT